MYSLPRDTTFEHYNPQSEVVRCPRGRSPVRTMLDKYAKATTNLYGVIPIDEFVSIFNEQNQEQTSVEEAWSLLLPVILKKKWYCFYKGYIVHHWAIDEFADADQWIVEQKGKPRFVPNKEELLKYENYYYQDPKQRMAWDKLKEFIVETWPTNRHRYKVWNELKELNEVPLGIDVAFMLLEDSNMYFTNEGQAKTFLELYSYACNHTRLWANKGFMPEEMMEQEYNRPLMESHQQVERARNIKKGANDLCSCGSGQKYKRCCRNLEQTVKAQLSFDEMVLFGETFMGLLSFVNDEYDVVEDFIPPTYPNPTPDYELYEVSQELWEHPELISLYIEEERDELTDEQIELLIEFRDKHIKGQFFVVDYRPEYAVLIGPGENNEDILYGVKGISRSISNSLNHEKPLMISTVLLPFKDKIIYDGYIASTPIQYGARMKKSFQEMYKQAKARGIKENL